MFGAFQDHRLGSIPHGTVAVFTPGLLFAHTAVHHRMKGDRPHFRIVRIQRKHVLFADVDPHRHVGNDVAEVGGDAPGAQQVRVGCADVVVRPGPGGDAAVHERADEFGVVDAVGVEGRVFRRDLADDALNDVLVTLARGRAHQLAGRHLRHCLLIRLHLRRQERDHAAAVLESEFTHHIRDFFGNVARLFLDLNEKHHVVIFQRLEKRAQRGKLHLGVLFERAVRT